MTIHDQVLLRLRVELYSAAQLFKGENLDDLKTLVRELAITLDVQAKGLESPVARDERLAMEEYEYERLGKRIAFAPTEEKQMVYVMTHEGLVAFVALRKAQDDQLHWFRVSSQSTPHVHGDSASIVPDMG